MKKLNYWMLNIIYTALLEKYEKHIFDSGLDNDITRLKELKENSMTYTGKLYQSLKRIEEMREEISF